MIKKYLCGVSFQHELGECDDIHFYDSLEELKEKSKCWEECGVVEIEFEDVPENYSSHKWIIEQNMKWGSNKSKQDPKDKKESDQ